MKKRYFIYLSYDGSAYNGWQVQPGCPTIQSTLDTALSTITGEPVAVTGAGRTDTGVHASLYCAHFDVNADLIPSADKFLFRLNGFLPSDIAVNSLHRVTPDAHARFSALSRTYTYHILKHKDPYRFKYSWFLYGKIDTDIMNQACEILLNHTDFKSFSRLHSGNLTDICHIYYAKWEEKEGELLFTIKADRFLRNMVRAIVGTMIRLGFSKISLDEFEKIIAARDRGKAAMSAPASGLFLSGIEYPEEIFLSQGSL